MFCKLVYSYQIKKELPLSVSIRMPLHKTRQTGPPLPKQLAMAHLAIRTPNTKTLHRAVPRV